jgi:HEAT repeat protein
VSELETTLWESESIQDKYDAVLMMGKLGPTSLTALITALDHPLAGIRKISSTALGKLGTKATTALPSLLSKVSDSDTEVRKKALSAITQMGLPNIDIAVQPLTQALEDEQDDIRQIAAELLRMIEQEKTNALTQMLF